MTNLRMDEIEWQNLQNSAKFSCDEQPQNGRNSIAKSAKFCKICKITKIDHDNRG